MRDDAVLRRALPLDRGLGPFKTENQMMCFPVAAKAEATAHSK